MARVLPAAADFSSQLRARSRSRGGEDAGLVGDGELVHGGRVVGGGLGLEGGDGGRLGRGLSCRGGEAGGEEGDKGEAEEGAEMGGRHKDLKLRGWNRDKNTRRRRGEQEDELSS